MLSQIFIRPAKVRITALLVIFLVFTLSVMYAVKGDAGNGWSFLMPAVSLSVFGFIGFLFRRPARMAYRPNRIIFYFLSTLAGLLLLVYFMVIFLGLPFKHCP